MRYGTPHESYVKDADPRPIRCGCGKRFATITQWRNHANASPEMAR